VEFNVKRAVDLPPRTKTKIRHVGLVAMQLADETCLMPSLFLAAIRRRPLHAIDQRRINATHFRENLVSGRIKAMTRRDKG